MERTVKFLINCLVAVGALRMGAFLIDYQAQMFENSSLDKFFLKIGYVILFYTLWKFTKFFLIAAFPESKADWVELELFLKYCAYVIKQSLLIVLFGWLKVKGMKLRIKNKDLFMDSISYSR